MKKQEITADLFSDKRLQPLNKPDSKLVLQLFIAKITHDGVQSHQLLYGWCLVTSRPDISEIATIGRFDKVYSANKTNVAVARLSIYQHPEQIIQLVNQLLTGISFKDAANVTGIDTTNIKFDFLYKSAVDGNVRIRPILFNETSSTVSRNMFEKYMFHSPFGSTPSFTLSIVNLDKLQPLRTLDGFLPEYMKVLVKVLEHLTTETKMSYATTECARFGNIEFINGPCANIYERAQVYFQNISGEENFDGIKDIISKKIKVTVLPNEITAEKHLLINCFSTNGGQVILDEMKEVIHQPGETIEMEFETQEPISNMAVSIWMKEDGKWQIWFKNSAVLARQISLRMGAVGATGKVSSAFFNKILSAGSHMKSAVDEAMEINKTSYMTSKIGASSFDPWVDADYNFNKLVESLVPKKSDAAFFPKGWNPEVGEHGALAFLEWFKKTCDDATHVVIQDPYFDTVGLEFLARTSNNATSSSIITCTQTPSTDDDEIVGGTESEKPIVPNRATRLVTMLEGLPQLFGTLKLSVNDYRNKSGNSKSLLHDRYMIIYSGESDPKGFHLSNSIQNATQNYPLLITPIPLDVLRAVEQYSIDLLDEGKRADTFELVRLYDYEEKMKLKREEKPTPRSVPADKKLFAALKLLSKNKNPGNFDSIKETFRKYVANDASKFMIFWDTFGYFLGNVPSGEAMLYHAKKWFLPTQSRFLRHYLTEMAKGKTLEKFKRDRDLGRSGYHLLFVEDFDQALKESFAADNYFHENFGYGNYAVSHASYVLLTVNVKTFVGLLKLLRSEVIDRKEKENISEMPILRVVAVLFTDLSKNLFWHADNATLKTCLKSDIVSLRTLAIAAIVTDAVEVKHGMTFRRVSGLFKMLSAEEELKAYVALLHQTRFDRGLPQDALIKKCFDKLLKLLGGKNATVVFEAVERIVSDRYFESIDAYATNKLLVPLAKTGTITMVDIYNFWWTRYEAELLNHDVSSKVAGLIDLGGWALCIAEENDQLEFISSLEKNNKKYSATIRKPFAGGTRAWENDYNRMLMIQTAAMIAINYNGSNTGREAAIKKLRAIITEIGLIKTNYPYFRDYSEAHLLNKQIAEKF